jgi:hypothetical protein
MKTLPRVRGTPAVWLDASQSVLRTLEANMHFLTTLLFNIYSF